MNTPPSLNKASYKYSGLVFRKLRRATHLLADAGLPTGVHKKSKAGAQTLERLYSCERVFCSQTLDEPQCQLQPPAGHQGVP